MYGENIGWITLNPQTYGGVTNNAEGTLSGYAWSENAGWIDFSQVTIGSDGVFAGNAYSENIGWITFGTSNNKVSTDWRPASTRTSAPTQTSGALSYGYSSGQGLPNPLPGAVSVTLPPAVPSSGLSNTQVIAILSLLTSFGADASVIENVRASLLGTGNAMATNPASFTRDLKLGATGADVKQLQQFLNAHGFAVATAGIGSPGEESKFFGPATQQALLRFQAANGITPPAGYFGAKTRDYIKNLIP